MDEGLNLQNFVRIGSEGSLEKIKEGWQISFLNTNLGPLEENRLQQVLGPTFRNK